MHAGEDKTPPGRGGQLRIGAKRQHRGHGAAQADTQAGTHGVHGFREALVGTTQQTSMSL